MEVLLHQSYELVVTPVELRLIRKALGGRLKDDDIEEARKLDTEIAKNKVSLIEQQYNEAQKLKEHIGEPKES